MLSNIFIVLMLTYWVGNVLQVGMEQEPQQELMQQSKDLWFDILFIIIIIIIYIYIFFGGGGGKGLCLCFWSCLINTQVVFKLCACSSC